MKIFVVVLVLMNIFLLYRLGSINTIINNSGEAQSFIESRVSLIKRSFAISYYTNGEKIPLDILLKNSNNNFHNTNLKAILNNHSKLLFIYNTKDCNLCVKEEIKRLKKLSPPINSGQIVCLVYDRLNSYSKIFKSVNKLEFQVLSFTNENDISNMSISHTPALLLVNKLGVVINSFYPIKGEPQQSDLFYRYVEQYFKNNPN